VGTFFVFSKEKKCRRHHHLLTKLYTPPRQQNTKTTTYRNTPEKAGLIFKQLPQNTAKQRHTTVINTQDIIFQNHAQLSTETPRHRVFFEKKFQTLRKKSYIKKP
jgi:hypothetical protein